MYVNTSSVAYYGLGNACPLNGAWPKEINGIEDLDLKKLCVQVHKVLGGFNPKNPKLLKMDKLVIEDKVWCKERIVFLAKGVRIIWTKQE